MKRLHEGAGIHTRKFKSCLASVKDQYGGDESRAYAVCTASFQKAGYFKSGSQEVTKKGKKVMPDVKESRIAPLTAALRASLNESRSVSDSSS